MNTEKQKKGVKKFFSQTPRTDAATELYGEKPFMVAAVPVEFAEGLERELAELWSRFDTQMQAEAEASNLKAICDEQHVKQSEWRELGPDEVICEGDQYEARHLGWQTAGEYYLSRPAHAFRPTRFCTRRPLPTTKESSLVEPVPVPVVIREEAEPAKPIEDLPSWIYGWRF